MFRADPRAGDSAVADVFVKREFGRLSLEIRARDRVGLLYKIARAIDSCGYDIEFARVNTERNRANDAFRISPRAGALPVSELEEKLRGLA